MDISSKGSYPANQLSNFAVHPFTLDCVECASMEGFLQSLKFADPDVQRNEKRTKRSSPNASYAAA